MKQILCQSTWSYTLTKEHDVYELSYMCGSVGLYERSIILTNEQIEQYHKQGKVFLDELVQQLPCV